MRHRLRAMRSYRSGDASGRLLGIYLEHTPQAIQQFSAAVDAADCSEAQRISHTIKSSSEMLGPAGLAPLLSRAEEAARNRAEGDLCDIVGAIESGYELVHAAGETPTGQR